MILLACLLHCVGQQSAMPGSAWRELVIREVAPGGSPTSGEENSQNNGILLGDHNNDGQMDLLLEGTKITSNLEDFEILRLRSGLQSRQRERYLTDFGTRFDPQLYSEWITFALLGSPVGMRAAIMDLGGGLPIWDLETRIQVGSVPIPPPPVPGLPGVDAFVMIQGGGDVNGDGWGDLFFQDRTGGYGITGLIDGLTLQVVWQALVGPQVQLMTPPEYPSTERFPDLDGDGAPDFVAGFAYRDSATGRNWCSLFAYSGTDGRELWQHTLDGYGPTATCGPDWTGDAIADFVLVNALFVAGVDGATGSRLWTIDQATLSSRTPPEFDLHFLVGPSWVQVSPPGSASLGGSGYEVWTRMTLDSNGPGTRHQNVFFVMEADSGRVMDLVIQPDSLMPWRDYSLPNWQGHAGFKPLGDLDRDGLVEFGRPMYALDVDDPNIPGEPYHYVIYGQRTLIAPDSVALGQEVGIPVWIPAAPGHSVYLLASDSFEGEAGYDVDGWHTRLGPSLLLNVTRTLKPGRTVLDSQGQGTIRTAIPNWTSLSGRKIYLRAVVEKPGLAGDVWTISSVGLTQVR